MVELVDQGVFGENYVNDYESCPTKQKAPGMHTYHFLSLVLVMLALSMDECTRESNDRQSGRTTIAVTLK